MNGGQNKDREGMASVNYNNKSQEVLEGYDHSCPEK